MIGSFLKNRKNKKKEKNPIEKTKELCKENIKNS